MTIEGIKDFNELLQRAEPEREGWQERAVKILRASQIHDDWSAELSRICAMNLLGSDFEQLKKVIEELEITDAQKSMRLFVMIARAMEIRKIYERTHHVFLHAQTSRMIIFSLLVKEIMKMKFPEKKLHQFKFLRMPEKDKCIDYAQVGIIGDMAPRFQRGLISVNTNFLDAEEYDSAVYYACENSNGFENMSSKERLEKIIQKNIPFLSDFELETICFQIYMLIYLDEEEFVLKVREVIGKFLPSLSDQEAENFANKIITDIFDNDQEERVEEFIEDEIRKNLPDLSDLEMTKIGSRILDLLVGEVDIRIISEMMQEAIQKALQKKSHSSTHLQIAEMIVQILKEKKIKRLESKFVEGKILEVIRTFFSELSQEEMKEVVASVMSLIEKDPSIIGNLFVFAIPKEKSGKMQYRSHSYGIPCRCHEKELSPEDQTECKDGDSPQFRIFAQALQPGDTKIYAVVSEKEHYKKTKLAIRNIVRETVLRTGS